VQKTAELIDLPFGLWVRVVRRRQKFSRFRQLAPIVYYGTAHWRHLANTIEPSVCCGDAALCQIILTTCYYLQFYETSPHNMYWRPRERYHSVRCNSWCPVICPSDV